MIDYKGTFQYTTGWLQIRTHRGCDKSGVSSNSIRPSMEQDDEHHIPPLAGALLTIHGDWEEGKSDFFKDGTSEQLPVYK